MEDVIEAQENLPKMCHPQRKESPMNRRNIDAAIQRESLMTKKNKGTAIMKVTMDQAKVMRIIEDLIQDLATREVRP